MILEQDINKSHANCQLAQPVNLSNVMLTAADVIQIRQALAVLHSQAIYRKLKHTQDVAVDAIHALDMAERCEA